MKFFNRIFGKNKRQNDKVAQPESVNINDILFTIPTLSNEFPLISQSPLKADFDTCIFDDDWRQNEFLNFSALPLIEVEIEKIKEIWHNHSRKVDEQLTAFTQCHIRGTIGTPNLQVALAELFGVLGNLEMGALKIGDFYVTDGFSLKTANTTYYGSLNDSVVTQLCISSWNDSTMTEILKLTERFNLVFVNWYHSDIIRHND